MNFMTYDLTFLVVFTLIVVWFLWTRRKKLGREGPIFLYRTKIGLKFIDKAAKKLGWLWRPLSYVIVGLGYVLMAIMIYFLFQLIGIFARPEYVQLIKIPPIIPLFPYLPSVFKIEWLHPLYFTYWIIIIAVVAIVHEGFHGIFARYNKVKVKSTGFGFLGPILTFFVEPNEKQMRRKKIFPQLSVLAAGVFANILTAILFFFIMWFFFSSFYTPAGALFNTYSYAALPISVLGNATIVNETIKLDGENLTKISLDERNYFVWQEYIETWQEYEEGYIQGYYDHPAIHSQMQGAIIQIEDVETKDHQDVRMKLDKYEPGDMIKVLTKNAKNETTYEYEIELGEDYSDKERPVIGVGVALPSDSGVKGFLFKMMNSFRDPTIHYEPLNNSKLIEFVYFLLWWMVLVNIGVALFNILPLGITDGGRFWYLTVLGITKNEKLAQKSFSIITWLIILIFVLLMILWYIGIR